MAGKSAEVEAKLADNELIEVKNVDFKKTSIAENRKEQDLSPESVNVEGVSSSRNLKTDRGFSPQVSSDVKIIDKRNFSNKLSDLNVKEIEHEDFTKDPLDDFDEDPAGEFFECESEQCNFMDTKELELHKCRMFVPDRNNDLLCFPIEHYDDVLKWVPPSSDWSKFVKPLKKRTSFCAVGHPPCRNSVVNLRSSEISKTLVCHDMKGGYINDRFAMGHHNLDEYKFINWANIDIFVYFSHYFLTIPPLAWINAGHLHGVKVLGTIISEGKCGSIAWHNICRSKHLVRQLALKLGLICKHYGFDGYLLNIENEICVHHCKEQFLYFIKRLHAQLKRISAGNLLIWYDSVTIEGNLDWQDCLNEKNSDFFAICDGIYLNYGWNEPLLEQSESFAGNRKLDVYAGIDVFGRGTFGGGGFSANEALKVIRKHGLSAAIFAPGWVHEKCPEDVEVDVRDFLFWHNLSQFLYCYGPCELPFETSFCRGYGHKMYEKGLVTSEEPWFDQSKINYVPSQLNGTHEIEDNSCFVYYEKDGFCGGGCLLITQKLHKDITIDITDCLLICDFISEPGFNLCIEVFTKPLCKNENCEMDLIVTTVNLDNLQRIESISKTDEKSYSLSLIHNEESMVNGWQKNKFDLSLDYSEHIVNVSCMLTGKHNPLLLGYLKIYSFKTDDQDMKE